MAIARIIIYISSIIWLLPAVRQYGKTYFLYFLILALSDPFSILCITVIGIPPDYIHSIAALFLYYSFGIDSNEFINKWLLNLLLIVFFLVAIVIVSDLNFIILILHFLIFLKFIKQVLISLHKTNAVNIFLLAFVFYELTIIMNILVFISSTETGIIFFYLTLSFQILVAIFFTIFREENTLLHFKLRTTP
jgi:hypothetical protein